MTSVHCLGCIHYRGKLQCSAYPDRIPADIMKGLDPHQAVRADQTGTDTYQMDPDIKAAMQKADELMAKPNGV